MNSNTFNCIISSLARKEIVKISILMNVLNFKITEKLKRSRKILNFHLDKNLLHFNKIIYHNNNKCHPIPNNKIHNNKFSNSNRCKQFILISHSLLLILSNNFNSNQILFNNNCQTSIKLIITIIYLIAINQINIMMIT